MRFGLRPTTQFAAGQFISDDVSFWFAWFQVTDGERLPLAVKELGTCDLYPQVSWRFYGLSLTSLTFVMFYALNLLFYYFLHAFNVPLLCNQDVNFGSTCIFVFLEAVTLLLIEEYFFLEFSIFVLIKWSGSLLSSNIVSLSRYGL